MSSLLELARGGDARGLAHALTFAPSPRRPRLIEETRPGSGFTPLLLASWHGHCAVLECLLAAGADPSRPLPNGADALYLAARNGHTALLRRLLSASGGGPSSRTRNVDHSTALHSAAKHGQVDCIAELLAHPNWLVLRDAQDRDGSTPLLLAAGRGHAAAVEALCAAGAGADSGGGDARCPSALLAASYHGHAEVVRALLRARPKGVDASLPNGTTALHMAALRGNSEVARVLIEGGARAQRLRGDGSSAAALAAGAGHAETAALIAAEVARCEAARAAMRKDRGAELLRRLQQAGARRGGGRRFVPDAGVAAARKCAASGGGDDAEVVRATGDGTAGAGDELGRSTAATLSLEPGGTATIAAAAWGFAGHGALGDDESGPQPRPLATNNRRRSSRAGLHTAQGSSRSGGSHPQSTGGLINHGFSRPGSRLSSSASSLGLTAPSGGHLSRPGTAAAATAAAAAAAATVEAALHGASSSSSSSNHDADGDDDGGGVGDHDGGGASATSGDDEPDVLLLPPISDGLIRARGVGDESTGALAATFFRKQSAPHLPPLLTGEEKEPSMVGY
jgi:ankyrin repeat protein